MLVPTITDHINAHMIAQAGEQMKLIANFGNGVDHIDVTSALAPRHHRHQYAGRPDRGHRRHDDGADPRHRAPARRGRARHSRRALDRLVADLDARAAHHRQAARHRRHGPHRPGAGAARARLRHVDPLSQPPPRRRSRSRRRWRRPIGIRSTRCWRGWTSSRSTARTRRRPIICCRRGG